MEGRRSRVSFTEVVLLGAVLLLAAAPAQAESCEGASGVDLCDDLRNSTLCDCDIVSDCVVHIICNANSTYRGPMPDFSQLEKYNYSLFL